MHEAAVAVLGQSQDSEASSRSPKWMQRPHVGCRATETQSTAHRRCQQHRQQLWCYTIEQAPAPILIQTFAKVSGKAAQIWSKHLGPWHGIHAGDLNLLLIQAVVPGS